MRPETYAAAELVCETLGHLTEAGADSGPCTRCYAVLCAECDKAILPGALFVEVRRHDPVDADTVLAVHTGCIK